MASFKVGRMAEDIKREMTAILRELKDPRIAEMLTIVRVELSNDLSHCKIFVSCFEGSEKAKQSVKGLESASGFIRHELFKFIADDSLEHSAEINQKLRELIKEEDN